jgi:hypothetical protein
VFFAGILWFAPESVLRIAAERRFHEAVFLSARTKFLLTVLKGITT